MHFEYDFEGRLRSSFRGRPRPLRGGSGERMMLEVLAAPVSPPLGGDTSKACCESADTHEPNGCDDETASRAETVAAWAAADMQRRSSRVD